MTSLEADTTIRMRGFVAPFFTPISKVRDDQTGDHWGIGSYVCSANNERAVLTANHVAKCLERNRLTHQFYKNDDVFAIRSCGGVDLPEDAAICRTYDASWQRSGHAADCIPMARFASRHDPVQAELLFLAGIGSTRSAFYFNTLFTTATPYTTQERELTATEAAADPRFNPHYHFALLYQPDRAQNLDGSSRGLPNPDGMSGALVWNTKRIETEARGDSWSPAHASATGLVWGWHSSAAVLLATRVEHLHAVLDAPTLP